MMWGAPGIGKSDIVKQIGDEQSREVIDIRLPLWEPTDIKGIPFYNSKSNAMESSLWEIRSLRNHYHSGISILAKLFDENSKRLIDPNRNSLDLNHLKKELFMFASI